MHVAQYVDHIMLGTKHKSGDMDLKDENILVQFTIPTHNVISLTVNFRVSLINHVVPVYGVTFGMYVSVASVCVCLYIRISGYQDIRIWTTISKSCD